MCLCIEVSLDYANCTLVSFIEPLQKGAIKARRQNTANFLLVISLKPIFFFSRAHKFSAFRISWLQKNSPSSVKFPHTLQRQHTRRSKLDKNVSYLFDLKLIELIHVDYPFFAHVFPMVLFETWLKIW